jgi:hypothetical protein
LANGYAHCALGLAFSRLGYACTRWWKLACRYSLWLFEGWVADEQSGNQTHGHIVLEHVLNSQTVGMAEKWLPTLQKVFNVIPALACNNVSQPYWEFVYPLQNMPAVNGTNTSSATATTIVLSSPVACAAA